MAGVLASVQQCERDGCTVGGARRREILEFDEDAARAALSAFDAEGGSHDRARFFLSNISEHADGERRGPVAGSKAPKDASHRDPSDAALRFDLGLGVRRRHAPKSC